MRGEVDARTLADLRILLGPKTLDYVLEHDDLAAGTRSEVEAARITGMVIRGALRGLAVDVIEVCTRALESDLVIAQDTLEPYIEAAQRRALEAVRAQVVAQIGDAILASSNRGNEE